ncbi:MAG: molybdopterin-dependent oxidoreductase, partial [candidate division Zixibacteria bacterium]|nr:molybdopterin-dependent oxidoreductase [candidate division Zixibacteria bacterium]
MSRREFLTFLSTVGLSSSLLGYLPRSLRAQTEVRQSNLPLLEDWVPSVCRQCPGGCGILVRVIQGKAIKIEGNPLHPVNQGRLCPKGQSGLHVLYDPDRIRSPLRRKGERGAGKWEEIGWEEAIGQVSDKLKELRREDDARSLVVLSGQKRGIGSELLESFTKVFGSPNFVLDDSDYSLFSPSVFFMQGVDGRPCYDLLNANYVLSFNSSILETSWSPVQAMRAYGSLRERRLLKRSRLVHAGPYLSLT